MRRLWWWAAAVAAGLLAAGWWGPGPTRSARAWVVARVTNPLPHIGPLEGAAFGGAALWADRPGEAVEVRALAGAMRSATPVVGARPGRCLEPADREMTLLPARGQAIHVQPVWTCGPGGGPPPSVRSPDLVWVSVGERTLGSYRAPRLVAAYTQTRWGSPVQPHLDVTPSVCAPGCRLTLVGQGFIELTARIQVLTDLGTRTLATVPVHDGDFTWRGALPAGMPPGTATLDFSGSPPQRLTVLPAGVSGWPVTSGPPLPVVPAQTAHLRYPPLAASEAAPGQGTAASALGQDVYAAKGGRVLRTPDGGRTWTVLHDFQNDGVIAASFGDASDGWAAVQQYPGTQAPLCRSGLACLMRTTDGGATWRLASAGPPSATWIHLFSTRAGVIVSQFGTVYRTGDGGATWTAWGVVPWGDRGTGPLQVGFGSPDFGVASLMVGAHLAPALAVTTDGGRSWTVRPVAAREIVSISTPAAKVIWMVAQACSGAGCAATVERSTDGGATWSAVDLGEAFSTDLPNWPFQVVGQSATAAWLVVPGHQMLHTDDGGMTWAVGG